MTYSNKLCDNNLIPESMRWIPDELIFPHLKDIFSKEIDNYYRAKEAEIIYEQRIMHYEKDSAAGRLVPVKPDNPPDGMYS